MSLWTPSGEHNVGKDTDQSPSGPAAATGNAPSLDDLSPEQRAEAEAMNQQMEEARGQLLATPSSVVIAQNALAFYELAALYLSQEPARLDDARSAIDALQGIVESVGDRLGDAHEPLTQALNQIQMAYVTVSEEGDQG